MPKMYREGDRPVPGYQLLSFLGEGGFGEVWKATNESGIEIALKILNLQGKQSVREVFAIRQLRNIRHPNLIPIHGFWLKDEAGNILQNAASDSMSGFKLDGEFQFFVSMGLGDKTLMDRLEECRKEGLSGIPLDELMQYMDEAGRALDFLNTARHDMGGKEKVSIEHCDIKPQNILLVGGSVQICDFGLARVQQQGVKQNQTANFSHHYVAPEMLKREQGPGRTTDQYSLAISYVQLRTGKLPFGDTNFAPAILTAHLEGTLDLSMLPINEQQILKRATRLNPAERYPTARAFTDALRELAITQSRPIKAPVGIKGPLRVGTEVVPGYRLEELIGRGSFGEVWRATAPGRLKKAIKIIRNLELASSRQELRSLDLITEVRHPYLLQIEACFLLDKEGDMIPDEAREIKDAPKAETLVIVSELAESHLGKRLQDCLAGTGQGVPPKELLSYMRHVAIALDRLNSVHDIIHRDVKPENILLVGGIAKLADFGLAKALEGSSAMIHTKSIGMTPAYAAPELCNGRIEKATDQYSLALTYYHLRTGQLATGEVGDLSELIRAHLSNKLDFSLVSPVESQILQRASALQSSKRFPNCVSFIKALMGSFSRSDLPREATYSTAESMEEMPALDSSVSLNWQNDSDSPASPAILKAKVVVKAGETINKLTDTAREAVAKSGQKSTKKDIGTGTAAGRTTPRRRRSRMARLVVTLLMLGIVGGIITGVILIARNKPMPTDLGRNIPDTSPTKPVDPDNNPIKPTTPVPTVPIKVPLPTKPIESVRLTAAELLKHANDAMLAKTPAQAAGDLLELAKRYQSGEAPYDPASLLLAADCFPMLPDNDSKRKDIATAYNGYANQFFKDQALLLRNDAPEINWAEWTKLLPLAGPDATWVQVFEIEKLLHQEKLTASEEAVLRTKASKLTTTHAAELGPYALYLRGAIANRLKNPSDALKAFVELDKKQSQFRWTTSRQKEIVSTVQTSLVEKKQRAFQVTKWQEPVVSGDDAASFARLSNQLEAWTEIVPSDEDRLLVALAASQGTLSIDQAKALVADWKAKKLHEISTVSPQLVLAVSARQLQLMMTAKEPPEAMLPAAYRLVNHLQAHPEWQPKPEECVRLYETWIKELGSLTRLTSLPVKDRQQLAFLYSTRARLIMENALTPLVHPSATFKTAHDDLITAIDLTRQVMSPEMVSNTIWLAFAKRELKQPGWQQLIANVNLTTVPQSSQPVLLLLQGYQSLEQDRLSKTQSDRLDLVKKAQGHFTKVIDETPQKVSGYAYWLNLARLGSSQAHLEHANYQEIGEDELTRKECREHLKSAEELAQKVAEDSKARLLRPEAEMAWGNAAEDFGLLLGEKRHEDAVKHFTLAVEAWKGNIKQAQALMNRARAMIRAEDPAFQKQIEKDLKDALDLKPEGDIASEIHYWKAGQLKQNKQMISAKATFEKAVSAAKSPGFRDTAKCALLELVMVVEVIKTDPAAVNKRIDEITRALLNVSEVDPQIRKRAEMLQLNAWNELDNLYFVLLKGNEEKESNEKKFLLYLSNLESSTELLAKWHAAKQRGRRLILQLKWTDAWQAMELDGKFAKHASELKSMSAKQSAPIMPAFLALSMTRYELLINRPQTLKSHLLENIPVLDQIRKLIDKDHAYSASFIGFAGLMRWNAYNLLTDQLDKTELAKLKTEVVLLLTEALQQAPNHLHGWRWTLALADFEEIPNKRADYLRQSLKLLKAVPESEMNSADKAAPIKKIEAELSK